MACKNEGGRQCFTFIWKVENVSYYWTGRIDSLIGPCFVLEEIDGRKLFLSMSPRCRNEGNFAMLILKNYLSGKTEKIPGFAWELAFLALDGTVLLSCNNNQNPLKYPGLPFDPESLLATKSSKCLPRDTLTARIRIWKNDGEMLKNAHSVARTIIGVERRTFTWKVRNFSSLKQMKVCSYEVVTQASVLVMTLNLFLNEASESRRICFTFPNTVLMKRCVLHLSLMSASGNIVELDNYEFRFDAVPVGVKKEFAPFLKRNMLVEKKSEYLPNDVLTLQCTCRFTSGIINIIEGPSFDDTTFEKDEKVNTLCLERKKDCQSVLKDKLKSMLADGIHTDIKLRTSGKSYPAHKCILSMWSPVFKAMFSNNMRENIKDYVDIEDLNDDTVFRLLQYVYSAEIEELEWDDATELYEAADKYQILTLRDICSSFLKARLCQSNACAVLLLADLHHDEDLKNFVQVFILKHGKDVMNSEEWENLMKTNLKLAAETMHLIFKR